MKICSFRKYDSTPSTTYDYKLITKLTDLGSPDAKKNILGYYLNLNKRTSYTTDSPSGIYLTVYFRISTADNWLMLGTISQTSISGTQLIEDIFEFPIRDIKQIQIKLEGGFLRGDISINDFGLFYRKYRGSTVGTLDE